MSLSRLWSGLLPRPAGRGWRHLSKGGLYRIAEPFADHDGRLHEAGMRLEFRCAEFLPYEDGLTLRFRTLEGGDATIRLQDRPAAEGAVVGALERLVVPAGTDHPSVFASLYALGPGTLVAYDGVRLTRTPWHGVLSIRASFGRQLYDHTRILTIRRSGAKAIFLPESEPLWAPFLAGVAAHLSGARPFEAWDAEIDPETTASATVYRRPLFGRVLTAAF